MGCIDHTLLAVIDEALDHSDETAIIVRLSERYGNKHERDLEHLGMKISTASVTVVTGTVPVGKIRDISHLLYVLAVQSPIKQHLLINL